MRALLVALLVVAATLLAGCGSKGPQVPAEIVVQSKLPVEVRSNDTSSPDAYTPSPKTKGHIAGVVVDEAIRPIAGANVKLPGMDLNQTSDRDGVFGFVDLPAGQYFLTVNMTGYYPAETTLQVQPDEFTRAKFVLKAIPPPTPFHVTQQFSGFADATGDPVFGLVFTCTCSWDFYMDQPGLKSIVAEATMSKYTGPSGSNSFSWDLGPASSGSYSAIGSGQAGNPMRVEMRDGIAVADDHYGLQVTPEAFPVPETNKAFTAYVTAFYNELPKAGWSLVAGDE